ncbi:MAG: hypothetical protein EOO09_15700 [Chitinophagaceae bacterium]|nr:MAG: hypothetical protein EOO09_15700 [Chitinophagaceae bacterium]
MITLHIVRTPVVILLGFVFLSSCKVAKGPVKREVVGEKAYYIGLEDGRKIYSSKPTANRWGRRPSLKSVTVEGVTYTVPQLRYILDEYGSYGWHFPDSSRPQQGDWLPVELEGRKMSLYFNFKNPGVDYYYNFPGRRPDLTLVWSYKKMLEDVSDSPAAVAEMAKQFPKHKIPVNGNNEKLRSVVAAYNADFSLD